MAVEPQSEPWVALKDIISTGDSDAVLRFLESMTAGDTARAISRLEPEAQNELLSLLEPEDAADLIEELPSAQAADLIEELPEEQAAAIVDEMPSDQQADLLGALNQADAEAILQEMDPEEAKDARTLLSYPGDTAGGLMVTEYLSYSDEQTIDEILEDLRKNAETYATYDVLYAYITKEKKLSGIIKLRDLLLSRRNAQVDHLMIKEPVFVYVDASLEDLKDIFDRYDFFGVPVVDRQKRLVGIVRRVSLREALESRAEKTFLQASGIFGGEELRNLPVKVRALRRFSFLAVKLGMNLVSVSVIKAYQDTLAAVVALAVFLPVISDLGGVAGNQSLAVSIRELTLGLIKPKDFVLVLINELKLGVLIALFIAGLLSTVAFIEEGNIYLGLVVGAAMFLNTIIACTLGGIIPLILRRMNIDPAVASSGVLTFITDAFGFFFALCFATMALQYLH